MTGTTIAMFVTAIMIIITVVALKDHITDKAIQAVRTEMNRDFKAWIQSHGNAYASIAALQGLRLRIKALEADKQASGPKPSRVLEEGYMSIKTLVMLQGYDPDYDEITLEICGAGRDVAETIVFPADLFEPVKAIGSHYLAWYVIPEDEDDPRKYAFYKFARAPEPLDI